MFTRLWKKLFTALSKSSVTSLLVTKWKPMNGVVSRFVAGQSLNEALEVVTQLQSKGFLITIDHLGEGVTDKNETLKATNDYCEALESMHDQKCDAVLAIKLSQLGLKIDESTCESNLIRILSASKGVNFVEIDMEDSTLVGSTLKIFKNVRSTFGNVGIALQAYLRRTEDDLVDLLEFAKLQGGKVKIRLVKGTYDEPPEVAFKRNADVNASYLNLTSVLFNNDELIPAIATHNDILIEHAMEIQELKKNTGKSKEFEFQMLLGVRRDRQIDLLNKGYAVRLYLPYGESWYPYLMRRIGERPANGLFLLKQIFR